MIDEDAPDADLARRAAGGDDAAFSVLMRRHKTALYRFARRYVGEPDAAFEVVQETFASAWGHLSRYDPSRSLTTWLRAIALNKCRDRARRDVVRRLVMWRRDFDSGEALDLADPAAGAEAALIDSERRAALDAAIAALPAKLKEPLILTAFEEMSHQEAARLLGVTPMTIETRIYRARRRLAEALSGLES